MIEKDLGGEDNWKCQSEQYYTVAKVSTPMYIVYKLYSRDLLAHQIVINTTTC